MKRKRNLTAGALAFLIALSLTLPAFAANAWESDVGLTVAYGQTEARSMLDMINAFRTGDEAFYWASDNATKVNAKGEPLVYSYALEEIAMQRAAEIALSFSHTRPDGTLSLYTAFASDGTESWGENIAAGSSTASATFKQWREDDDDYSGQGHRRNMLNANFAAVGVGHVAVNGTHYWAQEFSYDTDSFPATAADDTQRSVTVTIASSQMRSAGDLTASPDSLSVAAGADAVAPVVSASILLQDAWPGRQTSVTVAPTWSSGDESVFTVSGQTITGLKAGSANLYGAALGETISVPVTVTGGEQPLSAQIYGNSLTLNGTIGVNFYLTLPQALKSDAAAYVTLNGEKRLIKDASHGGITGDPSGDYYAFTWTVPAKKMNDVVTLQVYSGKDIPYLLLDGNGVDYTDGYSYSVAAYLRKARETYSSGALRELADAMSDYGALAQMFFKHDTDKAAVVSDAIADVSAESFAPYEPQITVTENAGVSYVGSNLRLESETSLRHYFRLDIGRTLDDYEITLDGSPVTPTLYAEGYCAEVPDIAAKDLGQSHALEIRLKSGGDALTIENYSALSYGWKALHGSRDDNLRNLVKGLYLYCQKAQAYFAE